ncbi:putative cyclase [Lentinus tigrinus ALCF2SS1-7]|uniref:Putative cyclase n=1 Tax=Lentinus tigrinus ALCF2SS1-6 TaxID=1328759 RepID=A0A5C2S1N5_9APHY|nr:putative cyclase [Lentinus tigrinus ALCF2SS1-6]RPD72026.1 putative cyclase [Lentinus tigrinus ALCF2SS1-7]
MSSPHPVHVIDLTHPLVPGKVPAWPGHPCYNASLNSSLAKGQPANVHALTIGTHTGTHLDAPYHFFMDGVTVDRLDLTLLTAAPAVVADVRHRGAHERITWEDLSAAAMEVRRREARVLLLCTGWSRHWGQPNYSDHPWLDAEAAHRVLDLGVRVIGLDTLSPDELTPEKEGADVHRIVLGSGGVIVENLARLDTLVDSGWKSVVVSLLPLALEGCDGSPLRAVAWEGAQ